MAENVFVIDATSVSGQVANGGTIAVNGSYHDDDFTTLKAFYTVQNADNRSKKGFSVTTIDARTGGSVVAVNNESGTMTIELDAAPTVGQSVAITADWPLGGVYPVISVDGNTFNTGMAYFSCVPSGLGTYTLCSGVADPFDSDQLIAKADWCDDGSVDGFDGIKEYRTRVLTDCWQCFTGVLDPCDVTVDTTTVWTDRSKVDDHQVYYNKGGKVVAADDDGERSSGEKNIENV